MVNTVFNLQKIILFYRRFKSINIDFFKETNWQLCYLTTPNRSLSLHSVNTFQFPSFALLFSALTLVIPFSTVAMTIREREKGKTWTSFSALPGATWRTLSRVFVEFSFSFSFNFRAKWVCNILVTCHLQLRSPQSLRLAVCVCILCVCVAVTYLRWVGTTI